MVYEMEGNAVLCLMHHQSSSRHQQMCASKTLTCNCSGGSLYVRYLLSHESYWFGALILNYINPTVWSLDPKKWSKRDWGSCLETNPRFVDLARLMRFSCDIFAVNKQKRKVVFDLVINIMFTVKDCMFEIRMESFLWIFKLTAWIQYLNVKF